ncbi:endonuclease/exonuclease/phosphatase family protein [Bdellovibrio sp. HCB337]|uniref:endonuclease/exonuclease/phosphatase family protein n=1 Tax=Bdellovibrio sp. HCB337 TaxID=3394358 RepID=UPI0039A67C37
MQPIVGMYQIARILLVISILWHFEPVSAQRSDAFLGNLYKSSTINFGNPGPQEPLPAEGIRLFVWNIHKAEDARMYQDFADLSFGADIAVLQEAISKKSFTHPITDANPNFGWTLAKSFLQLDLSYTGVATGSRVRALTEEVIVSNVKEPVIETPKTILLSEFAIENSQDTLLIANIHGINFVSTEAYKVQINQLLEKISLHHGPMIVAGDFNTWSVDRRAYLEEVFGPLGLKHVQTPIAGVLDLDHVYIRDLEARFVFDLSHIDSSDHAPLMMDLTFETNKVMMYESK